MNIMRFYKNFRSCSVTTRLTRMISSCCNMAMTYLLSLQIYLLDIVSPCLMKTIVCVHNNLKFLYYYWNVFSLFLFWRKHIYKMFFSLVISLTFTSFIRSLICDGSQLANGVQKLVALIVLVCVYQNVNGTTITYFYIFIYFVLLWKFLNIKSCLSKFATKIMFQWKAIMILSLLYLCSILLLHEDIKSKPGPRNYKNHLPSFCQWNLNSLPAHNFTKMLLLKAYNMLYISTILYVCLKLILIPRYRQITFPQIWKAINWFAQTILIMINELEFCIYYKESLPVRVLNIPYLQKN